MQLIKPPRCLPDTTEKAVERFVNGCIGIRPGCDNPEATFYSQKLYNYAKTIVEREPFASTQSSRFHYTDGHTAEPQNQFAVAESPAPTLTKFLRTDRQNILMRTPRISNDADEKIRKRTSFNSAYQLCKMNQLLSQRREWQKSHYRFDCADRKQQYCALDDFNHDEFNSRTRNHRFRSHKPERPICDRSFDLNRKPNQLETVRVSMLDDPNYVNKEKYKFPARATKKPLTMAPSRRETASEWKKHYKKDGSLLQQSKISILLQERPDRQEFREEARLNLMHRPLKSDAFERQRDLSQSRAAPSANCKQRATSTRFFDYPRGVYDVLYPRSIRHR